MPRAELTLTIPEDVWIGELSRGYPEAEFRVLAAVPDEDGGVGLAEVTAEQLADVLGEMRDLAAVTGLELLGQWEETALVQFETSRPLLLLAVQGSGVPLEMPFTLTDGEARWEITAPQERLSDLGEQLDEFGIPFRVDRVTQHVETEQLLTESQLELVQAAVENGYYDTPRDCSLTDLADEVGIAKSTCSETLHRAEEKIVKRFVGDLG
ncbi:helix-turn-helix domain-containing protein [Halomicrobium salinisoli]|uniref:helix-turn-helix domain-containing protein n=1 Tax=Halomicrobium salinisoli TaxID=2878391 RepID=UPI001CEFBC14|nr:helix-turn-helix domain-containing protein [Halomicrobium salinisoli]